MLCLNMQENLNTVINKLILMVECKCPGDTTAVGTGSKHCFACCSVAVSSFFHAHFIFGEQSRNLAKCSFVMGDGWSLLLKTAIWSRSLIKALLDVRRTWWAAATKEEKELKIRPTWMCETVLGINNVVLGCRVRNTNIKQFTSRTLSFMIPSPSLSKAWNAPKSMTEKYTG